MTFEAFPKMARLSRECIVTEKIDGTNAQVFIRPHEGNHTPPYLAAEVWHEGKAYEVFAGSRTRIITPGKTTDNFGFAAWVYENVNELVQLGPGRHFGEWWGRGIQRGYSLNEKRFSLFHTHGIQHKPDCVSVVPTLYVGPFDTQAITHTMYQLRERGSEASPGFMNPEGIVVYHTAANVLFKKTFEKDDTGKDA